MSLAQTLRLRGWNASKGVRGIAFSFTIASTTTSVAAVLETVDAQSRDRLNVFDAEITDVLHVARTELAGITFGDIPQFTRADNDQSYRVKLFKDDPQRPAVLFHCVTV